MRCSRRKWPHCSGARHTSATAANTRICASTARLLAWLLDSIAAQSIEVPSSTDAATLETSASSVGTGHLFRHANERAFGGLARRIGRWLAERLSELLVRVAYLDAPDDWLPFLRPEPRERPFVAIDRFASDRLLERRLRAARLEPVELGRVGPASFAAQFVPDPVQDRLSQVRLERTDAARLEAVDPLRRLKESFLDKVVGIGEIAGPSG
jgi:hypothetical protein